MKKVFIDTNISIRYLTNDDPAKADRVELLLDRAEKGEIVLITTELVIAEIVWVLESFYGLKNTTIEPMIHAILATPGLKVINGSLVDKAIDYYVTHNIDFIDGYISALMDQEKIDVIYSYDKKHLSRIHSIQRKEP